MAPIASLSSKPTDEVVGIEEIVFSCSICQALVSEVYATTESNQGFHSGSGDEDGIVTKMWITECSHVTCAKHLEGGAAPFHPKDMAPRAACPKCLRDNGDESLKDLFGIRGLQEGEYDTRIPLDWLRCPSIKLDGSMPGMMALRFQYMALYNYSFHIRKRWKSAQQKQSSMEAAYSKERKERRHVENDLQEALQRVRSLERTEAQLKKWEDRKPMIEQYMGIFPQMISEIESMRARLLDFGVVVPRTEYAFSKPQSSLQNQVRPDGELRHAVAGGQRSENVASAAPHTQENSSSTRKRKREHHTTDDRADVQRPTDRRTGQSRDLMPPPLPKARPQLRTNDDHLRPHALQETLQPLFSRQPIEVYQDSSWARVPEQPIQSYHPDIVQHSAQPELGHSSQRVLPYRSIASSNMSRETLQKQGPQNLSAEKFERDSHMGRSTIPEPRLATAHVSYATQGPYVDSHSNLRSARPTANDTHLVANTAYHPSMVNDPGRNRSMQQNQSFRPPLQALSQSDTNRRLPSGTQDHYARDHPSIQQRPQEAAPATSSPFFRPETGAYRLSTSQRPLTRGNVVQRFRDVPASNNGAGYQASPLWQTQRRENIHSRAVNTPSYRNGPPQQVYQQPSYLPPYVFNNSTRNGPTTHVPQTPRNSDGLLRRPDRRPAATPSQTATRPQSNAYRNRVSLPPRSGPAIPVGHNQDEALLQVPGIRGVSSQRGPSSYQHGGAQVYSTARSVFSSEGGRRTALR